MTPMTPVVLTAHSAAFFPLAISHHLRGSEQRQRLARLPVRQHRIPELRRAAQVGGGGGAVECAVEGGAEVTGFSSMVMLVMLVVMVVIQPTALSGR